MVMRTFFWHDYETNGTDPFRDRPTQFAGLRTTLDLEPLGEPVMFFCQPAPDVLPHPEAALLTRITPQQCERDGLIEADFASRVHDELGAPGTCGVGFNSLRFDDEFTRNLLYRNFYDPYAREWENNNSRWDLIDLVRLCYALRPEGIEWPRRNDGNPSFRLEHLAAANRLTQTRAHDAMSDVETLVGLARLIRMRQPRLFDYYFELRRKQAVFTLLDVARMAPILHVSSRYSAERGCIALVAPIAMHPSQPNGVIVVDLDVDPTPLLELDADAIADRVFTPRTDLPNGIERIPLKVVHANKSPALAPMSVLRGVDMTRIGLDVERGLAHLKRLRATEGIAAKVRTVFARSSHDQTPSDPELALYQSFANNIDRHLFAEVRRTPPEALGQCRFAFQDARFTEILFRYRARNWPDTLDASECALWQTFRTRRLTVETDLTSLTLDAYFARIATLRAEPGCDLVLLDQLDAWGHRIANELLDAT